MSKYGNRKTKSFDGHVFDSKLEHDRYVELYLMQEAGEIAGLKLQPKFELQPAFKNWDNKKIQPIRYIGDFCYLDKSSEPYTMVVEECKGHPTKEWRIKKKLFEYKYKDVELRIIKREDLTRR